MTLPEDREYSSSPSVYRGSTPKGGGSLFTVNSYISSLILKTWKDEKNNFNTIRMFIMYHDSKCTMDTIRSGYVAPKNH